MLGCCCAKSRTVILWLLCCKLHSKLFPWLCICFCLALTLVELCVIQICVTNHLAALSYAVEQQHEIPFQFLAADGRQVWFWAVTYGCEPSRRGHPLVWVGEAAHQGIRRQQDHGVYGGELRRRALYSGSAPAAAWPVPPRGPLAVLKQRPPCGGMHLEQLEGMCTGAT